MDKLQPLIRHHYWICFGFSLIFTVTGWFLASGSLGEAIAARETAVKGSFSEAKSNSDAPNARWVEAAKLKNEADSKSFSTASTQLRERQKSARQWPAKVADKMKGINFQDQIKDQLTRELWASIYGSEIEEMLKIVRPFQIETGEGLVVVDSSRVTHRPYNGWTTRPPESKEIWDAQEDIWLLRSLLNSINNVNGNAERITEAPVREIYRLTLRGGDRNAAPAAPGAGGMGGMGAMGGMMETSGAASAGGGDGGMGAGGGASIGSYPGKDFEGNAGSDILGEEFGADASAAAGGGGGIMGGMPGKGGMGSMGMSEMSAGMGAPLAEAEPGDGELAVLTARARVFAAPSEALRRLETLPVASPWQDDAALVRGLAGALAAATDLGRRLPASPRRERYAAALQALAGEKLRDAVAALLDVLDESPGYDEGRAKAACLAIFKHVGLRHPIAEEFYRRYSMAVNV